MQNIWWLESRKITNFGVLLLISRYTYSKYTTSEKIIDWTTEQCVIWCVDRQVCVVNLRERMIMCTTVRVRPPHLCSSTHVVVSTRIFRILLTVHSIILLAVIITLKKYLPCSNYAYLISPKLTPFHQHFGSDITSAPFTLNWSRVHGATLTCATRRYAAEQTQNKCWFYVTSLPKCWWNSVYWCYMIATLMSPSVVFSWFSECGVLQTRSYNKTRNTRWRCKDRKNIASMSHHNRTLGEI